MNTHWVQSVRMPGKTLSDKTRLYICAAAAAAAGCGTALFVMSLINLYCPAGLVTICHETHISPLLLTMN